MTNAERVELAVQLFKEGYNCAQSVTAAFADLYGYTRSQALKMSASFGGGIGRMRYVCGAASGMFILAGLDCGTDIASDTDAKAANYKVVQQLAAEFVRKCGSLVCADLLGLDRPLIPRLESEDSPMYGSKPAPRTEQYYQKRPCAETVRIAANIFAEYLELKQK
ncbi:MAG: C-GCAxxG-C-C family protein [Bacteroidaceae bacterium]|nr:C-GCAxxG-C-C family protein [Bacteroidaceae bacterium]